VSEWPAGEKYTHAEVRYSEGKGNERCAKCVHFIPPKSCEHVQSPIGPEMWCRLFEPRNVALRGLVSRAG
jgi:hypothetical protein